MTTLQAEVRTRRINPVTKFPEAYLSGYSKFGRIALTTSFVLFLVLALNIYMSKSIHFSLQLCCVIFSLVAIILFRISLLDWMYQGLARDDGEETFLFSQARLLTSLAASSLNLLVIICLNKVNAFILPKNKLFSLF